MRPIPHRLALLGTLFVLPAALGGDVGWRGDGSGRYPEATPPAAWGRISSAMKGLRCQADKPASAEPAGHPMPDGVVREWLVLGPVPIPDQPKALEQNTLENELQLDPKEGDAGGGLSWKKLTLDTSCLDFAKALGKQSKSFAYACTHIFAPSAAAYRANLTSPSAIRTIVNGKPAQAFGTRTRLDLVKGWNCVLFKTPTNEHSWSLQVVLHGIPPAEYEDRNIAWRRALPGAAPGFYSGGSGAGALVVSGERLFVPVEPSDLYCLRKSDGHILWVRTSTSFEALAPEERKSNPAFAEIEPLLAQLNDMNKQIRGEEADSKVLAEKKKVEQSILDGLKKVDSKRFAHDTVDIGQAGFTPITDGKSVYVWHATGVTACYDLDGNRRWSRLDKLPGIEHGFASSPVLSQGKIVVYMRDVMAFDAVTGALAWKTKTTDYTGANPPGYFMGTPLPFQIGGTPVIALGNGTILRSSDGQVLCKNAAMGNQAIASPVLAGNLLLQLSTHGMTLFLHSVPASFADPLALPTRPLRLSPDEFPKYYVHWYMASPLVVDDLAYLLNNNGVLSVVDVNAGKVVYDKMLDLDPFQSHNEGAFRGLGISPALAGKRIYLFGNNGGALVIEPGRQYKQVAKNKIEHAILLKHWSERQERFAANPVFDGKRLYLRSEAGLYAIEEK